MIRPPTSSTLFPYTTLFRSCRHRLRRQNVGYSNFSQPQSHLSFCVLLQYLVERRRVVTQILKQNAKDRKSGSAGMPRPISYAVFCLKKKKSKANKDEIRMTTKTKDTTQLFTSLTP